jgi:hypothetical protein
MYTAIYTAIMLCLAAGAAFALWHSWRVRGPFKCRLLQHFSNFCVSAGLCAGIIVCFIGFLHDIGWFNASL